MVSQTTAASAEGYVDSFGTRFVDMQAFSPVEAMVGAREMTLEEAQETIAVLDRAWDTDPLILRARAELVQSPRYIGEGDPSAFNLGHFPSELVVLDQDNHHPLGELVMTREGFAVREYDGDLGSPFLVELRPELVKAFGIDAETIRSRLEHWLDTGEHQDDFVGHLRK